MERKKCLKAGRGRRICKNGRCSEISEGERLLSEGERGTMGRVNLGMRVLRERERNIRQKYSRICTKELLSK